MASPTHSEPTASSAADESLSRSTFQGLKWTYGATLVSSALQVVYTAAMARLLRPADFGILAVALVFLRFGHYFAQMGVGAALVQAPSLTNRMISCGFAITMAFSVVVAGIFIVFADFARVLLDDATVIPVVRVMALGMIIVAAGTTAESLLRRELRFRRLAINHLVSYFIGFVGVGITAAALGAGIWSLAAASLSQLTVYGALNIAARRHPVTLAWSRREAGQLIRFGGRVSMIGFAEFLGTSLDTVVIGRTAGSGALGQYNRAFYLVNLPLERLLQGVQRVLFPAFTRIQTERQRLGRVYRSGLRMAGALLIPTAAGMSAAATPLVLVLLGDQWTQAAAVLPFLAFAAVGSLLAMLAAILCEATADLNRKLVLQVIHVVVLVVLLLAAGPDLRLLAAAVSVAQIVRVVGYFGLMHRTLGTTLREHLQLLLPSLTTGAVVAAAGATWNVALGDRVPTVVLLTVHVLSGVVLLVTSLRVGPLSGVRSDAALWLDRAGGLDRIPASLRRIAGLRVGPHQWTSSDRDR